ncbi:MAG: molybdenum cofactor guanylyltransferase [Candidatus Omnitrophota bacterium]|nr:molybdenum cofactor guanylyltransferase [Candidatus Omnitrophota bacterium]
MPYVTGYILAGGKSSRMGRDKALLTVGSRTLIEVVMERIKSLVDHVVVVGSPRNARPLGERLGRSILTDLKPDCGPLMGIYTGLMATETTLNLFVPCDMPWVEGRLIERLARTCREGADVAASLHPLEGMQPFPLVCRTTACRTIGALLDAGERSLQALLREPRAQLMDIKEPELWHSFTNINTVSDYAKLSHETAVTPRP